MFTTVLMALILSHCTPKEEVSQSNRASTRELETAIRGMVSKNDLVQVTNVKYLETKGQCVNLVSYSLNGKLYENVAVVKGIGSFIANQSSYDVESDDGGSTTVKCTGSCDSGSGGCRMSGSYDPNTGSNTLECSCEGCTMVVK